MIVHICCSVDSWYYLTKLREKYPDKRLIGFFYNPNIHPFEEYEARKIDAKRSCDELGIEFVEGEYDYESWYEKAKDLALEPEKGKRCSLCFDLRLYKTAELADQMGATSYTTTLLMSPKKDINQLKNSADQINSRFDAKFVIEDFRKSGGTQAQFVLAKEKRAYKQNYCGCMFALNAQRNAQKIPASELFASIDGDFELSDRARLYKERVELEKIGKNYLITKEKVLNSRILEGGLISADGKTINSKILPYSSGEFRTKTKLVDIRDGVQYAEKNSSFVVTRGFASDLSADQLRLKLNLSLHSLNPVFVVDRRIDGEITLFLKSVEWQGVREVLVAIE